MQLPIQTQPVMRNVSTSLSSEGIMPATTVGCSYSGGSCVLNHFDCPSIAPWPDCRYEGVSCKGRCCDQTGGHGNCIGPFG
jgi:hypothetical protein